MPTADRPSNISFIHLIAIPIVAVVIISLESLINQRINIGNIFNGQRAYSDIQYQVNLGPRIPGSKAHDDIVTWIQLELTKAGWETEVMDENSMGHLIQNITATRPKTHKQSNNPLLILGAHYDSRLYADRDPDPNKRLLPVPGANDGASGVAVLLELARILPSNLSKEVWLVFFDVEDNGGIEGWEWILGSRVFLEELDRRPDAVIIIDMVGDSSLNIHFEQNSDQELSRTIWTQAASMGYARYFIQSQKYRLIDDHLPFVQAGIPAVDLIDFDYPYWHTTADTLDKVSCQSIQIVGDILLEWIIRDETLNK